MGSDRVGVRLSPANPCDDIAETATVYAAVVAGLQPLGPAYLHVVEGPPAMAVEIRSNWSQTLMADQASGVGTTPEDLGSPILDQVG